MKKQYIVRFIYWDGSKENEIFHNKFTAKLRSKAMNHNGYNSVVKRRYVRSTP